MKPKYKPYKSKEDFQKNFDRIEDRWNWSASRKTKHIDILKGDGKNNKIYIISERLKLSTNSQNGTMTLIQDYKKFNLAGHGDGEGLTAIELLKLNDAIRTAWRL